MHYNAYFWQSNHAVAINVTGAGLCQGAASPYPSRNVCVSVYSDGKACCSLKDQGVICSTYHNAAATFQWAK